MLFIGVCYKVYNVFLIIVVKVNLQHVLIDFTVEILALCIVKQICLQGKLRLCMVKR